MGIFMGELLITGKVPKNTVDGFFHGKPYFLMDDFGGESTHYFWKHPISQAWLIQAVTFLGW